MIGMDSPIGNSAERVLKSLVAAGISVNIPSPGHRHPNSSLRG